MVNAILIAPFAGIALHLPKESWPHCLPVDLANNVATFVDYVICTVTLANASFASRAEVTLPEARHVVVSANAENHCVRDPVKLNVELQTIPLKYRVQIGDCNSQNPDSGSCL